MIFWEMPQFLRQAFSMKDLKFTSKNQTKNWNDINWNRKYELSFTLFMETVSFSLFPFWFYGIFLGEVIYTAATTKPSAMPTSSLLRSSLSVNSRHHQRTTSGMTSSSSATSSNSNNINNERHRDNNSRSSELQKPSGAGIAFGESREDDSPKDGPLNRLHAQNGKFITSYIFSSKIQNI